MLYRFENSGKRNIVKSVQIIDSASTKYYQSSLCKRRTESLDTVTNTKFQKILLILLYCQRIIVLISSDFNAQDKL